MTILGRYNSSEFLDIIERESPDIAFLPSVCPETYSFTLSEAVTAGIYPVVFDLGAMARRIRSLGWGKVLPIAWSRDPQTIVTTLLEVTPTPPPPAVFNLARGVGYPDVLRNYYGLEWSSTVGQHRNATVERAITKAALRELRF